MDSKAAGEPQANLGAGWGGTEGTTTQACQCEGDTNMPTVPRGLFLSWKSPIRGLYRCAAVGVTAGDT